MANSSSVTSSTGLQPGLGNNPHTVVTTGTGLAAGSSSSQSANWNSSSQPGTTLNPSPKTKVAKSAKVNNSNNTKIVPYETYQDDEIDDNAPDSADSTNATSWISAAAKFFGIGTQNDGNDCPYKTLAYACGYKGSLNNLKSWAVIRRVKPQCTLYKDIALYIKNSKAGSVRIKQIYKVDRKYENLKYKQDMFRIMLWHGTRPGAIPGIIEKGFQRGYVGLFGSGSYFADRFMKSQGYAFPTFDLIPSKFFVLAEVSPGRIYKSHHVHMNFMNPPHGFDTVKGMGSLIPDWTANRMLYGAILPCGKSVYNQRHRTFDLSLNEYIVYDSKRIRVRFIVECNC